MTIETTNRYEHKYLLTVEKYIQIRSVLSSYMLLDPYNVSGACYTVGNIYYDTQNDSAAKRSLSKSGGREKIRLRAYGVPEPEDNVYLETKKRSSGTVYKTRAVLPLSEASRFLSTGSPPSKEYTDKQALGELTYYLLKHKLEPKVYIAYDRIAYFEKENPNLRICFDTNIRTRRHSLDLSAGSFGIPLLEKNTWLMEIKSAGKLPSWLNALLEKYKIIECDFSKYGAEYQKFVKQHQKKEEIVCSMLYQKMELQI